METKAREHEDLIPKSRGKDALDHAIAAIELYMKASAAATSSSDKARLKRKCEQLIARAEILKKASKRSGTVAIVQERMGWPRVVRPPPVPEQTLLLRSSRLHGNLFPPWESEPGNDEFEGDTFSDSSEFSLSDTQRTIFAGWRRPSKHSENANRDTGKGLTSMLMQAGHDYDLVQDLTTDCSVVASLCAGMKHLRPGALSILPAIMFPNNLEESRPEISANGKYIFRLHFNGCFRKVVIDDRLPASNTTRTLHVFDRENPRLIWPALMEKAYLKVRGGYDFPGSNSATDLWILTGWIPQQLFLRSDEIDFNQTWKRVNKAYGYGDVIITLGTGRLSDEEEEALGLAGEHDYAVLDMAEIQGTRRLLVKNPWCDGLVWNGSGMAEMRGEDGNHSTKLTPGSFWIDFDDVAQHFQSLYLNWNPGLFTERQDYHFTWELPKPTVAGSFLHNPQYAMRSTSSGSVWILLSRHFQDQELELARSSRSTSLAAVSNSLGFMSLYIFNSNGERVQLSDKSIYRGPFVDSPQTLATIEAKQGATYTVVAAQQDLPFPKYTFTLSFFSRGDLHIRPAEEKLPHHTEVKGAWTRRTAGGNSTSATYLQNPQFSLTVPVDGPLSILLSTNKDDLPVHVDLVWARGQRVTAVGMRDLVASSGDYRRGCTFVHAPFVNAGVYTIVCSTFEAGQLADFALRVDSEVPCQLKPVLADAAGRLRTEMARLTFNAGEEKKKAVISATRIVRATLIVQLAPSGLSPLSPRGHGAFRMSVQCGHGPNQELLATTANGDFKEVSAGLRTPDFDIDPNTARNPGVWVVVERMGASQVEECLLVEIHSEGPVHTSSWETVDN